MGRANGTEKSPRAGLLCSEEFFPVKTVLIPKGNGKFRKIHCPDKDEMAKLRALVPALTQRMVEADKSGVMHGFFPGRSCVTNAMQHRGYRFTLKFDLKDFFDTVKRGHFVETKIPVDVNQCFVEEGYTGQGLPTSPILANIAAAKMDEKIVAMSRRQGRFDNRFAYTRYADDLTFSFNDQRLVAILKDAVPRIVAECGFVLNEKKTRLQCADYGRRMVTGIAVDDQVHPRRETKRRLRAAKHQNNSPQVCGLEEYCKLKVPKKYVAPSRVSQIVNQVTDAVAHPIQAVRRAFGLRRFRL